MRRTALTCTLLTLLGAAAARAQDLPPAAPLNVELQTIDTAPPTGERLSLVAEVVGVPVVLEQVIATSDLAVSAVRVRNNAAVPLTQIVLAVTAVRLAGGTPVRRTVPVAVTLLPGVSQSVDVLGLLVGDLAALWAPGETGLIDVAVVSAQAGDGTAVDGDLGPPVIVPADTPVACGDATWHATPSGETATDPFSGQVRHCDEHGRWRVPAMEGAQ